MLKSLYRTKIVWLEYDDLIVEEPVTLDSSKNCGSLILTVMSFDGLTNQPTNKKVLHAPIDSNG